MAKQIIVPKLLDLVQPKVVFFSNLTELLNHFYNQDYNKIDSMVAHTNMQPVCWAITCWVFTPGL